MCSPLPFAPVLLALLLLGCTEPAPESAESPVFPTFQHHFIAEDMPGDNTWGFGTPGLADFDRDGDLDYAVGVRGDSIYWFAYEQADAWTRHTLGHLPVRMLGAVTMDVDGDGWTDFVTGGYWLRNSQAPAAEPFTAYRYDAAIDTEIHDMAIADIDGDGRDDLVALGDKEGLFWYRIPDDPAADADWPRTTITLAVLDEQEDIHGGFAPRGVGDLDGDGDPDLVLPDRWLANQDAGQTWAVNLLPFGERGPWGLSARSWITDLDADGDADIVIVDSDQTGSQAAWLESDGAQPPAFTVHQLPQTAPGTRGSFHSLAVVDFDADGDLDVFTAEQEDDDILPEGAGPRWYIWENVGTETPAFVEHVVLDAQLGGHDVRVGDVDGDGDLDLTSKIWSRWAENGNAGREHADFLENQLR